MAAETLALTQPAVTRTIRELEIVCNHPLIERDGRGIRLTSYGDSFLAYAGSSLASARSGMAALNELADAAGPTIRVGALPTVSVTLMPRAVSRYLQTGMRTKLRVVSGENRVLLEQLRNGELDLVMGRLPAPDTMQGLMFEPLYYDRVVFVVAHDHPILSSGPGWAEKLDDYPMLVPPPHSIIRPFVERLFVELGLSEPRQTIETVAHSFGHAFVRGHRAIWVISRGVVEAEILAGSMAILPVDTRSTQGSIGLITRAGIELAPAQKLFADILRTLARET